MTEFVDTASIRSGRSDRSTRSHRGRDRDPNQMPSQRSHGGRRGSRDKDRDVELGREKQPKNEDGDGNNDRRVEGEVQSQDGRADAVDDIEGASDGDSPPAAVSGECGRTRTHESRRGRGRSHSREAQPNSQDETATSVTGGGSEPATSMQNLYHLNRELERSIGFRCARYFGSVVAGALGVVAYLSPIVMVVLPKIGALGWETDLCGPDCEGQLISFTFKLIILALGSWALFFRRVSATAPRIIVFRAIVVLLIFILTVSYWLFYGLCILKVHDPNYPGLVAFCVSFVDGLLFVHYLAVILLEIRHLQPQYVVKVLRSPDGVSCCYSVGQLTIQELAIWCLQQYYKDFEVYNPYLERRSRRNARVASFKIYNVDGSGLSSASDSASGISRGMPPATLPHRDSSHNDRFYEEIEYERTVRRRRARLIVAAEEAFSYVRRIREENASSKDVSPYSAAESIYPIMSRAFHKFLSITRQEPRYNSEAVIEHLADCIAHEVSAKAFLERYLTQGPVIWNDADVASTQTWSIVSSKMMNGAAGDGCVFRLKQGIVTLLVTVRKLSHLSLTEDVANQKTKFMIRLGSETSV